MQSNPVTLCSLNMDQEEASVVKWMAEEQQINRNFVLRRGLNLPFFMLLACLLLFEFLGEGKLVAKKWER